MLRFTFLRIGIVFIVVTSCYSKDTAFSSSGTQECVVFRQGDGIWVMNPQDRTMKKWITGGVGKISVSRNGRLAYDRFDVSGNTVKDSNIYYSDLFDGKIVKLTNDDKSRMPAISPDGSMVLYDKSSFVGSDSKGMGTWLYSVDDKSNKKIAGTLKITTATKNSREESGKNIHLNEDYWSVDLNFTWSSDSKKAAFSRIYSGGVVSYWIDFGASPPSITPLDIEKDFRVIEFKGFGLSEILLTDLSGNDRLISIEPLSGLQRHFLSGSTVYGAQFSLDGKQIASFVREPKTQFEENSIWIINAANGEARQLTKPIFAIVDYAPSIQWSRDGSHLLVWTADNGAWIVSTKDGSAHELGSPMAEPSWTACPTLATESEKQ